MNRTELVPTGLRIFVHPQGPIDAPEIPLISLALEALAYQITSDGSRVFLGPRAVTFEFRKHELEEELASILNQLFDMLLPLAQSKIMQDLQIEQDVLPRRFQPIGTVLEKAKKPKKSP